MSAQNQTQDDGFHEIQLNGKQLVFLFMAATVVSVVIFLCGVLVGRGVRAERSASAPDSASAATSPAPDTPAPAAAVAPAGSDPTKAAPPDATTDDLSYFNRLEKSGPAAEELKPDRAPAQQPEPTAEKPAERTVAKAEKKPPVDSKPPAPTAPADGGFALQVAALRERGEAEAIAKRLSSKGYSAYVLAPANGTPSVYRVRVGQFKTRHEAEAAAARLQKEEQFKPWITR